MARAPIRSCASTAWAKYSWASSCRPSTVASADGEVRQQFSVCFACRPVGGEAAPSDETSDVGFYTPEAIEAMEVHPSIRLRVEHFLARRAEPYIG